MPWRVSRASRSVNVARGIPSAARKPSKRRAPKKASRITKKVQASESIETTRATEQLRSRNRGGERDPEAGLAAQGRRFVLTNASMAKSDPRSATSALSLANRSGKYNGATRILRDRCAIESHRHCAFSRATPRIICLIQVEDHVAREAADDETTLTSRQSATGRFGAVVRPVSKNRGSAGLPDAAGVPHRAKPRRRLAGHYCAPHR